MVNYIIITIFLSSNISFSHRASDKKIKLEIALKEATEFHDALQAFVDWLTSAEKTLTSAKPVSRVMETLLSKYREIKSRANLNDHIYKLCLGYRFPRAVVMKIVRPLHSNPMSDSLFFEINCELAYIYWVQYNFNETPESKILDLMCNYYLYK